MRKNKLLVVIGLLVVSACYSDWPPAIKTVDEIKELPANTKEIRGIGITDNEVLVIVERLPELDYLFINSWSKISDKSLADLAKLKKLRQVVIENGSFITDDGIKYFLSYPKPSPER